MFCCFASYIPSCFGCRAIMFQAATRSFQGRFDAQHKASALNISRALGFLFWKCKEKKLNNYREITSPSGFSLSSHGRSIYFQFAIFMCLFCIFAQHAYKWPVKIGTLEYLEYRILSLFCLPSCCSNFNDWGGMAWKLAHKTFFLKKKIVADFLHNRFFKFI